MLFFVSALLVASYAFTAPPQLRAPLAHVASTPLRAYPKMIILDTIAKQALQGATQGAVGAVVAASLSAFTEPVVNRVLVQ